MHKYTNPPLFLYKYTFIYSIANLSRTVASVPRPPEIEKGCFREDGARRPPSYYIITQLYNTQLCTSLNVGCWRTLASV